MKRKLRDAKAKQAHQAHQEEEARWLASDPQEEEKKENPQKKNVVEEKTDETYSGTGNHLCFFI